MDAVKAGMSPEDFWSHSPAEIADILEGIQHRKKQKQKWIIDKLFVLAQAISIDVFPPKERKGPAVPWEFYPELFKEEKQSFDHQKEEKDIDDARENRKAYAYTWNKEFRRAHKTDE